MADYPALPLWTDAYLSDTPPVSGYTWEHHGIYLLLLMKAWRTPNCRLPDDPDWLALHMGCSIAEVEDKLMPVLRTYFKSDGRFWKQKRLSSEYNFLKNQSRQQRARALKRWNSTKDDEETDTEDETKIAKKSDGKNKASAPKKQGHSMGGSDKALKSNKNSPCRAADPAMPKSKSGNAPTPTPTPTPTPNELNSNSRARNVNKSVDKVGTFPANVYEAAKNAAPGFDVYALESEWRQWVSSKRIAVQNEAAHFINFCKRHAQSNR